MKPTPGPFSRAVTQWVAGTPTEDAYGDEVPAFTSRSIRPLAEWWPQNTEADNAAGDVSTSDAVLLLQASTVASKLDEFTLSDGLRYRVNGAPAPYMHPVTGTAVTQVNLRRIS